MDEALIGIACGVAYSATAVGIYRNFQSAYPASAHSLRWSDAAFAAGVAFIAFPFAGPLILLAIFVRGISLGIDALVRRWSARP